MDEREAIKSLWDKANAVKNGEQIDEGISFRSADSISSSGSYGVNHLSPSQAKKQTDSVHSNWAKKRAELKKKRLAKKDTQIDELSKNTLKSYRDKAGDQAIALRDKARNAEERGNKHSERASDAFNQGGYRARHDDNADRAYDKSDRLNAKASKREKGADTAVKKLAKEDKEMDEREAIKSLWDKANMIKNGEQIDELSKKTLGSYIKKASDEKALGMMAMSAAHSAGGNSAARKGAKKFFKRQRGVNKAVDKLTKEDTWLDDLRDRVEESRKEQKKPAMKKQEWMDDYDPKDAEMRKDITTNKIDDTEAKGHRDVVKAGRTKAAGSKDNRPNDNAIGDRRIPGKKPVDITQKGRGASMHKENNEMRSFREMRESYLLENKEVDSGPAQHSCYDDDEMHAHAAHMKKHHDVKTTFHRGGHDDELSYHGSRKNVKAALMTHYGDDHESVEDFHPHV